MRFKENVKWSKVSCFVWDEVSPAYNNDNRKYHNLKHIESMYAAAHDLGFDHDYALDYAVMFHDVIYDSKGDNEFRSAIYAANLMNECAIAGDVIGETFNHIMKTKCHSFKGDNRIVILDMYGFTDEAVAKDNTLAVIEELHILYPDFRYKEIVENNHKFLKMMSYRLASEIEDGLVTSNIGACKAILNGLDVALTNPIYNG